MATVTRCTSGCSRRLLWGRPEQEEEDDEEDEEEGAVPGRVDESIPQGSFRQEDIVLRDIDGARNSQVNQVTHLSMQHTHMHGLIRGWTLMTVSARPAVMIVRNGRGRSQSEATGPNELRLLWANNNSCIIFSSTTYNL